MPRSLVHPLDPYWGVVWALERTLPISVQMRVMRALGTLEARSKGVVQASLMRSVLGERLPATDFEAVAREQIEFARVYKLCERMPILPGFERPDRWPIKGREHLEAALAQGKGVILVSPHFGYDRMLKSVLDMHGYPVWEMVARSNKTASARKKTIKTYSKLRHYLYNRLCPPPKQELWDKVLYADFNIRSVLDVLGQNGILRIMADGVNASNLIRTDFLGFSLPFSAGYAGIALRTGSPVLPAFCIETDAGYGIEVVIEEPLVLERSGNYPEDLRRGVKQFVQRYEEYVLRYPHLFRFWEPGWFEHRQAYDKKVEERLRKPKVVTSNK